MNNDNLSAREVANRLVSGLLERNDSPTTSDWKRLLEAHPEHAGDIADAALMRRSSVRLSEMSLDAPVDQTVFESSVSQAINMVHAVPSQALVAIQAKLESFKGPSTRPLAREVGLGTHAALLSRILAGGVNAPCKVLAALATKLETTQSALLECFRRAFIAAPVPSFKAEEGKPVVRAKAMPWDEAVKSLKLSEEETRELLSLDD